MVRKVLVAVILGVLGYGLIRLFFPGNSSPAREPLAAMYGDDSILQRPPDSVMASAGPQYKLGKLGEFFLGKHYRSVWEVPVKAQVFHMSQMEGGLQIEKLGGGMQTTSLTLTDSLGRRFALRSLDKDPISVLPPFWRRTFVGDLVRDQVSATNPYAALVVAPLAEAAGVFHTWPRLVYVMPSDQEFKSYAEQFGNKLFLMEEKFTTKASLSQAFGDATDVLDTKDVLQRRYQASTHHIDQWAFAKARLLDLVISDWDRHEGQWDWAEYRQGKEVWYKPIPKDRDQALCRYDDGVIPWLASRRFAARKFESFHPQYNDVFGLTINAAFLDARALPEVTLIDFKRLARELQRALTDEVLQKAARQLPPPVYALVGDDTYQTLRSRVRLLPQAAEEYYKILAQEVSVVGSDEPERFVIKRLSQGRTAVEVYRLAPRSTNGARIYSRTFFATETQKIRLYGLGGDDVFEISGQVEEGITLTLWGGTGKNRVTDTSLVPGWRKKTVIRPSQGGEMLVHGSEETENKSRNEVQARDSFIRFRPDK